MSGFLILSGRVRRPGQSGQAGRVRLTVRRIVTQMDIHAQMPDPMPEPGPAPVEEPMGEPPMEMPPSDIPMPTPTPARMM